MINLSTFQPNMRIAIIGASGGIGGALTELLASYPSTAKLYALSRQGKPHPSANVEALAFDFTNEASIIAASDIMSTAGKLDLIFVATGFLHNDKISPEKNLRALSVDGFEQTFLINTIGPAMTAKHMLPLLRHDSKAVFAALSARVGSISDNRLGGWYSYRASKAALNMLIKTAALEQARKYKNKIIIGLHPGTVDTGLSKPFQGNVPDGKLFSPLQSAAYLLNVVNDVSPDNTGQILDWDGKIVPA